MDAPDDTRADLDQRRPAVQIFGVFLQLGLTSFGGPIAHLAYFRDAFVTRRRWISEAAYAELVALCQILPGPTSSQVGFAIGLREAGLAGALAAFLGFTLPSAVLMIAAAFGLGYLPQNVRAPLFHGLVLVAVPVIAHAVVGMAVQFCARTLTAAIAAATLAGLLVLNQPWLPPIAILAGGLAGLAFALPGATPGFSGLPRVSRRLAVGCLAAFVGLLVALPVLSETWGAPALALADSVFRSGALVFGGGHVILPLLEAETAGRGMLDADVFLAGYGAAQALPGPLFTFAGFLGAASTTGFPPILAGLAALVAIFAPGFLVLVGVMGFWTALAAQRRMASFAAGAGAAVVGTLAAAVWQPVIASAILSPTDALIAAAGLAALLARTPVGFVVAAVALAGAYSSVG